MKKPSRARGCLGKTKLGRQYKAYADKLAKRLGKKYGVYCCPHCGCRHLTTKLDKASEYEPLIYVTEGPHGSTQNAEAQHR